MATADAGLAKTLFRGYGGTRGRFILYSGHLSGTPAGGVVFYKKQGRDSNAPANATNKYVTWITNDPNQGYSGAMPYGGTLVDVTVQVLGVP